MNSAGALRSIPVRPAITRMLRLLASSNSSSVATGEELVKAWQVVVPAASSASRKRFTPSRA
ncbi:hypothetical protein ABIE71_005486 [Bradyrhizobium diazoefficiens]